MQVCNHAKKEKKNRRTYLSSEICCDPVWSRGNTEGTNAELGILLEIERSWIEHGVNSFRYGKH